ncbi:MAG: polysaccharide biosynthesis/export family protein [Acidobacteria bacterium]|nr:polysaccharide biosynthesis/export family protein [Acidobacteriota bacterium]
MRSTAIAFVFCGLVAPGVAGAQPTIGETRPAVAAEPPVGTPPLPPDYVIGPDDLLAIVFWKESDMSAEVVVRPDGKIALPLLNDVVAAGLTPVELRDRLAQAAKRYLTDPTPTVVVKQINSRKVFITGQVEKPGAYPLTGPTTVVQLIATAGGLKEYAKSSHIVVMRAAAGRQTARRFNYKDVLKGRNLRQNVELKPGDTVIVP